MLNYEPLIDFLDPILFDEFNQKFMPTNPGFNNQDQVFFYCAICFYATKA